MDFSIEMRAHFAEFQEELDTTGECNGLADAVIKGDGEGNLLDHERVYVTTIFHSPSLR